MIRQWVQLIRQVHDRVDWIADDGVLENCLRWALELRWRQHPEGYVKVEVGH